MVRPCRHTRLDASTAVSGAAARARTPARTLRDDGHLGGRPSFLCATGRVRAAVDVACSLLIAAILTGCETTVLKPTAADVTRADVQRLEEENADLRRERAELQAQLGAMRQGPISPEIAPYVPRPVNLEIGSVRWVRLNDAARSPAMRIELVPLDSLDRFVQVTGWMDVTALPFPISGEQGDEASSRPITISLGPAEVRDQYRAGFMRPRYVVELPVSSPARGAQGWAIEAKLRDALTGRELVATSTVEAAPSDILGGQ